MLLKTFDIVLSKINGSFRHLLVLSIIAMFFVLMLQIFSRFLFFMSIPWSQDMLVFLLVLSVFLGAGTAIVEKKHIAVEFFVSLFPKKIENIIFFAANFVSIAFLGVMTYQSLILGYQSIGVYMGASLVPYNMYYWVLGVGCFIMMLNYLNEIIKKTKIIMAGGNRE